MNKKKDRKHGRNPAVFKNDPFAVLKGVSPAPRQTSAIRPSRPASQPDAPDETELFLRAVRGVRQVGRQADPATQTASKDGAPRETTGRDDEHAAELFLSAMGTIGTAAFSGAGQAKDEEGSGDAPRSSSSRMRQLRRGAICITRELDLHGSVRDEALRRLQQFIAGAFARGEQAVLVITGKGTNSPEGPVLPGAVAAWLREQGKGMVAEFHPAPRDKGGSGAVVVFLRRRR